MTFPSANETPRDWAKFSKRRVNVQAKRLRLMARGFAVWCAVWFGAIAATFRQ